MSENVSYIHAGNAMRCAIHLFCALQLLRVHISSSELTSFQVEFGTNNGCGKSLELFGDIVDASSCP